MVSLLVSCVFAYSSWSRGWGERRRVHRTQAPSELGKPSCRLTASLAEPGEILGWTLLQGPAGSHAVPQRGSPPSKTVDRPTGGAVGTLHPQVTPLCKDTVTLRSCWGCQERGRGGSGVRCRLSGPDTGVGTPGHRRHACKGLCMGHPLGQTSETLRCVHHTPLATTADRFGVNPGSRIWLRFPGI